MVALSPMTTDTPRTMHATLNDHDAAALYHVYCDSVGGKAYDGTPLPDWDAFSSDPTKEKQSQAWRDVAHFAFYASEREKVERLKEQLKRAVEIAEEALKGACGEWGCIGDSDEEDKLLGELNQLKATLNPTDK